MTAQARTDSPAALVEPVPVADSSARRTWRAFRRNPLGLPAVVVVAVLILVGLCAPLIAAEPTGYGADVLRAPSAAHWFGTDNLGRDIFAEVVWGTRASMLVAVCSSALAIALGVLVAVVGAYFRRLDTAVGTLVDLMLSLPVLPLMILIAALAGPSLPVTVAVIAAFSWPEVTRVVRSAALSVVDLPYMDAARVIGGSHRWIIRKHLLPATAPVIVVSVVLTASRAVLSAAGLAFLGLSDAQSWSWGRILYEAQQSGAMSSAWWTTLFPSLAILALVVSATLMSIAYNDARNPRNQGH
ncbi:peptide ABC transporter permease [Actinocatenispora thailandica]|uniref:Peptide ABC transporter permease n=1 Tax=Actinocatenispora thailandica TaxID=227318 RepID=A0A7R7DNJ4_9ACTN|nr:ABC transporter permease [Actinocatenispora thailandica]BCJ34786.1 peptide ABC transporter permease [Actinocatenispora thailandica]